MNRAIRRYFVCLAFTIELAIIVLFSEILRMSMFGFTSSGSVQSNAPVNLSIFVLFAFAVVPFSLMFLWHMNPIVMKKLFDTLGITEEMLSKKKDKTEKEVQK